MAGYKNIEKAKIFKFDELIDYKKSRIISLSICDTDDIRIVLFSYDEGEEITDEQTPNIERFEVIEGKVEVTVEGEKSILGVGDMIIVDIEKTHSLIALENSKVLQTSLKID